MSERIAEASPRLKAGVAGVLYLLTFATGIFALVSVNGRLAANLIADACYVAVTLLFVIGVNVERWYEQANAAAASASRTRT